MTPTDGIGGSLFPSRYLASAFRRDVARLPAAETIEVRRRQFEGWWRSIEARCGPATGLRALFDLVAMPLAAMLGFRARQVRFERARVEGCLHTAGDAVVGFVLLPWASAPSLLWREIVAVARNLGTNWCLLVAPPFISIVEARATAVRRSVDFALPDVLEGDSFLPFWTLTHATAFEPPAPLIDRLVGRAADFQDRVRDDLQVGVVLALRAIGSVVDARRSGKPPGVPFDEALTMVYRILFLLFAESRRLVPRDHPVYDAAYAVTTLCRNAVSGHAAPTGLWEALAAVTRLSRIGCRTDDLIVRPFNGRLFARSSAPSLELVPRTGRATRSAAVRDHAIGQALVSLGTRAGPSGREEISYADLGVEQLGAVYERVLDLDPYVGRPTYVGRPGPQGRPDAAHSPGRATNDAPAYVGRPGLKGRQTRSQSDRRKQTGTFYTPQPLAEFVVRRTLGPLVRGASADAILSLRVVDPAMGSGAFLVAACRYLAGAYERALLEEGRCGETELDQEARANIRRLVAERCLAGVDLNPVAVQLARLSLWLTSLSRGKPLNFLDHRLRVGNSLIGISPDDLWRRPGRASRQDSALPLFEATKLEESLRRIARPLAELTSRRDDSVDAVHAKGTIWSRLTSERSPLDPWRVACGLWCARWFWPASGGDDRHRSAAPSDAELRAGVDAVLKSDSTLSRAELERWISIVRTLAPRLGMFHWPLEFADVFYDDAGQPRARAGFDAVIGNPPWEMLRDEGHWPRAQGPGESGQKPRANGPRESGTGHSALGTGRNAPSTRALVRFIRESGQYPNCDRGHVNLYQPFLDRALSLTRPGGRVGFILPWGLAADDGATALRRRLFDEGTVDTVVGLDNSAGLFPIHRGLRFLVIVANPGGAPRETRARFGVRTAQDLETLPDSDGAGDASAFPVRLTRETIAAVGGPARRVPDVRRVADLRWLERLAHAHPPLGHPDGWVLRFGRELNATEDRAHFGPAGLPVVEGKHIAPFVVDRATPRARIREDVAHRLLPDGRFTRPRLAYRDVSGVANRLSLISAVLPAGVISTHTVFCLRTSVSVQQQHFLCGLFNSYVLNAVVRMLMGGHVTTSLVEHLPVPRWRNTALERRIARLAERLSRGPASPRVPAALQAAVARLYEMDDATYARILDGFPLIDAQERARALNALRALTTSRSHH